MSSFKERLAAAKAAARPHEDVVVSLDADMSERRAELQEQLEAARANPDARLAAKSATEIVQEQIDELNELTRDSLTTLRFYRLPGRAWAEVTARSPIRPEAPVDFKYGYNMHRSVFLAAHQDGAGFRLEGDAEVPLLVVKKTKDAPDVVEVDEWADVFDTISGYEFTLIADAVYRLNEWEPANRLALLKKGSAIHPA